MKLALRLFEWLPFPRRFSRMSVERRTAFLAKLEGSRLGPRRDLLLLAKTLSMVGWAREETVREVVGYEARCAVREGAPQPQAGPLGDLVPAGTGEDCDVAIVGSGAGATVRRVPEYASPITSLSSVRPATTKRTSWPRASRMFRLRTSFVGSATATSGRPSSKRIGSALKSRA